MTRIRPRGFAGQAVVSVLGVVALVGAGLGALFGAGSPARSVSLRDGSLWVQSLTGSLERLDTGSGAIGYRLTSPVAAVPLEIVDDGTTTVLRDPATGAIRSIDLSGARARLTGPSDLAREARLVSGAGRTFVLLAERGAVAVLDPATLAVGPATSVGGPLGSAAVDGGGTLWVAVPSLGVVVPVTADGGRARPGEGVAVGGPGTGIDVTVSAGTAYVIDRAAGVLLRLRPGGAEKVADVPAQAAVAEAQGDPADGHVVVGSPDGSILRIDPRTGRTARFDLPGREGNRLGPPVQSRTRIAVADLDTGELLVIDPATGATEARPVRSGPGPVPVTTADGAVVANDPGSPTAVVVTPTGDADVVDKGGRAPGDDEPDLTPTPAVVPAPAPSPQQGVTAPAPSPGASGTAPIPVPVPLPGPLPGPGPVPVVPGPPPPVRPTGPPGGVQGLRAVPGDATIDLSWTPAQDGGTPLLGHRVECSGGGGPVRVIEASGTATTATVAGVVNGVDHRCTVVPRNALGAGPAANAGPVRPLDDVPGAPTAVQVTAGDTSVTVRWSPPGVGGGPVARYIVAATSAAGPSAIEVPAGQTSATVAGLVNGTAYTVAVRAVEASGAAGPSGTAAGPVTPAGAPGPPQAVVAAARSRAIDVSWKPSAANGSPLTGYVVTAEPGRHRAEVGPGVEAAPLDGLTNGTEYQVTVVATNAVGEGTASAPKSATPGAPEIGAVSAAAVGGTLLDVGFDVDWKGEVPGSCSVVVEGGGTRQTPGFACGTTLRFDAGIYDTTFTLTAVAGYAGGEVQKPPVSLRTEDAPIVYLTRSMNTTPRDWFYGRPGEGNRFATVQDSGVFVYAVPRPGTVALLRWTDGRPDAHWYGREGEAAPPGYRVDVTLGYLFTAPGPGRSDIRRYARNDFRGPSQGRDCFLPSALAQYADLGPGGWTDEGTVGFGAPLP